MFALPSQLLLPWSVDCCVSNGVLFVQRPGSIQTRGQVRFVYRFGEYVALLRRVFESDLQLQLTLEEFLKKQKILSCVCVFVCAFELAAPASLSHFLIAFDVFKKCIAVHGQEYRDLRMTPKVTFF